MHHLEDGINYSEKPELDSSVYIYDGNALLHSLINLPDNFEKLAQKVFDALPKTSCLHFVTVTYKKDSIKNSERSHRDETETFLIKGPKTKIPRDWKGFSLNSENKRQLIKLLLSEWCQPKYASLLQNRHIYYACEAECTCIYSTDGITVDYVSDRSLCSSQEEADTRMMLHLQNASSTAT